MSNLGPIRNAHKTINEIVVQITDESHAREVRSVVHEPRSGEFFTLYELRSSENRDGVAGPTIPLYSRPHIYNQCVLCPSGYAIDF